MSYTLPETTNSVHVRMIPTGFFSTLFDSTYPTRLNGIISQDEFEKSINNINGKIAPNRMLDCTIIIAMSCTIAGIVLVVIGLESTDSGGIDPEMAMGGFGLFFLGLLFCLIVYCINSYAYIAKMEKAVNEESMKYRSRSPISSNWRIIDARYGTPIVGHFRNNKTIYTIEIEIDSSITSQNNNETFYSYQNSTESTSISEP